MPFTPPIRPQVPCQNQHTRLRRRRPPAANDQFARRLHPPRQCRRRPVRQGGVSSARAAQVGERLDVPHGITRLRARRLSQNIFSTVLPAQSTATKTLTTTTAATTMYTAAAGEVKAGRQEGRERPHADSAAVPPPSLCPFVYSRARARTCRLQAAGRRASRTRARYAGRTSRHGGRVAECKRRHGSSRL